MGSVTVRIVPNKDIVRVGENIDLRCDVSGDSDPTIRWTKVNGDFEDNVIPYDSVLKITDVRYENGGVSWTMFNYSLNNKWAVNEYYKIYVGLSYSCSCTDA